MTNPSSDPVVGSLATVMGRLSDVAQGKVDAEAVRRSLNLRSRYLAERLLVALDERGTGFAHPAEFAAAAEAMMVAPVEDKIRFVFRMHDHDGDGRISREEFERMIHIGIAEQRLRVADEAPERLVEAVFNAGDDDGDDTLTLEEFVRLVESRPQLRDRLAANGVTLLVPGRRAQSRASTKPRTPSTAPRWTNDQALVVACIAAFAFANLVAFVVAFLSYRAAGASLWIQIARGAGAMVNLDAALILLPMLRHLLTWLRRRRIGRFLPIDESIGAHRLIGETLMGAAVVHTIAHLVEIATRGGPWAKLLGGPWLTGMLLFWVFVVMWVFSRQRVRRSGDFELFHFTHLLYVPFFVIALFHAANLWMWVALPLLGYVGERIMRKNRGAATPIVAATPLPASVTRLDIRRPPGLKYTAGDYAFICIPAVAGHEWHPFTITSAPEQADVLTFHVRALGNWTSALLRRAEADDLAGLPIHIDGPYGAPATHIADSEHAIAIAAGIGMTPFASILRSILMRLGGGYIRIRRLHFVWISRGQDSFVWFAELLARLEALDTMGILDIHIYMTEGREDMGGSALELARELDREAGGSDLVTGLAARTTFGRPDLDALVAKFRAEAGVGKPDVYFCGPRELSVRLRKICARAGLVYREERF